MKFIKVENNNQEELLINISTIKFITKEIIQLENNIIINIIPKEYFKIKARLDNWSRLIE